MSHAIERLFVIIQLRCTQLSYRRESSQLTSLYRTVQWHFNTLNRLGVDSSVTDRQTNGQTDG